MRGKRLFRSRMDSATYRWRRFALAKEEGWRSAPELSWDNSAGFNRTGLINWVAAQMGAATYLEIGCFNDSNFHAVGVPMKVGVDPVSGGTLRMTSDAFFAQNAQTFDLVFIDGLHHAEQALRDLDNALAVLNPGGVVLLHDCMPTSWAEQAVPRRSGNWTGDVWKVIRVARGRPDLDVRIAATDHGCGVVIPRPSSLTPMPPRRVAELAYADLLRDGGELGFTTVKNVQAWLSEYVGTPA